MSKHYIFYNPKAGGGASAAEIESFVRDNEGAVLFDVTAIDGYRSICAQLGDGDRVTVCGGDGTLNRFINSVGDLNEGCEVYYFPSGSGNDFMREYAEREGLCADFRGPVRINEYIRALPTVTVRDADGEVESLFINGVGYGIDGYCCEEGDRLRAQSDKPVDYTAVAVKGLLFGYKPCDAIVEVDGKGYRFKKVWIAPVMKGKYYGGGMIPAPEQDRFGEELSLTVFHGSGKLRTLMIFPSIFKGEHVKCEKQVTVLRGKDIKVTFDQPRPLQIDGETVSGVKGYRATVGARVMK